MNRRKKVLWFGLRGMSLDKASRGESESVVVPALGNLAIRVSDPSGFRVILRNLKGSMGEWK